MSSEAAKKKARAARKFAKTGGKFRQHRLEKKQEKLVASASAREMCKVVCVSHGSAERSLASRITSSPVTGLLWSATRRKYRPSVVDATDRERGMRNSMY
jgi:hypothetical protein